MIIKIKEVDVNLVEFVEKQWNLHQPCKYTDTEWMQLLESTRLTTTRCYKFTTLANPQTIYGYIRDIRKVASLHPIGKNDFTYYIELSVEIDPVKQEIFRSKKRVLILNDLARIERKDFNASNFEETPIINPPDNYESYSIFKIERENEIPLTIPSYQYIRVKLKDRETIIGKIINLPSANKMKLLTINFSKGIKFSYRTISEFDLIEMVQFNI